MLFFMAILALFSRAGKARKTHPGGEQMNSIEPIPAEQKTTAQELIAANIKALIEQLEAGNSDALTAHLDAMSRFHRYSFGNVLSIARQRPGATRVCGATLMFLAPIGAPQPQIGWEVSRTNLTASSNL
jgi:hypothetical protein